MISQEPQFINMLEPADYQAGSTDCQSVNMGLLHKLTVLISLGAITGNDAVFKFYAGASDGTKTTELSWSYKLSSADYGAASSDVFGSATSVSSGSTGLTLSTASSWDHRIIKVDFHADQMPAGKPWLTLETDDGSASVLLMAVIGVAIPRFSGNTHATAVS